VAYIRTVGQPQLENLRQNYKMAKVRIARSKRYRKRYGLRSGRRAPLSGMRSVFSPMRGAMRGLYGYKQIVLNPAAIGPVSVPAGGPNFLQGISFNLGQVGGNIGPFTALYDQYRISKVVYQLIPKFNVSDANLGPGGILPMVATCIDYNDANTPANIGDIIQRQNAKLHRSKVITRVLKPCANFVVDAATGALASKQSPWLDITNITVPHFGIKLGITSTAQDMDFEVVVKYYLQFRQVR